MARAPGAPVGKENLPSPKDNLFTFRSPVAEEATFSFSASPAFSLGRGDAPQAAKGKQAGALGAQLDLMRLRQAHEGDISKLLEAAFPPDVAVNVDNKSE